VVASGLEAMTARLQAFIDRERSFTRDVSHELRTPLAVIRSAGDQLARRPELDDQSRRHADLIRTSTARLEQTVSTLLAMAREDHPEGESAHVVLLPLIEQAVVEQAPRLEGKSVDVDVEIPLSARLQVPHAVARILLANLIGNAFAHTTAGQIRIDTHGARLRIVNTFIGNVSSSRETPFAGRERSSDGFGFGLGIVRRLCERFDLVFELRIENGTVVAELPLAAEPVRPA
jgi:signal transduction histidine kinase